MRISFGLSAASRLVGKSPTRKAEQMIVGLGYTKGGDGTFRDAAAQPLTVKIEATSTDINVRTMLATADYWKRIGLDVETETISAQAQTDLALRSNFPGFSTNRIAAWFTFGCILTASSGSVVVATKVKMRKLETKRTGML